MRATLAWMPVGLRDSFTSELLVRKQSLRQAREELETRHLVLPLIPNAEGFISLNASDKAGLATINLMSLCGMGPSRRCPLNVNLTTCNASLRWVQTNTNP